MMLGKAVNIGRNVICYHLETHNARVFLKIYRYFLDFLLRFFADSVQTNSI
jgi:hypothetical protein